MTSEPEAAVLPVLEMLATKPDRVPDIETERRAAAAMLVAMARGAKRTRLDLAVWVDMAGLLIGWGGLMLKGEGPAGGQPNSIDR
jgi:hypothetical protein